MYKGATIPSETQVVLFIVCTSEIHLLLDQFFYNSILLMNINGV